MKVPANMEEALSRAGLARKTPLLLKQKHGMIIHRAAPGQKRLEGDGWVSDVSGLPVAVYSADCIPLLVWDRDLKAVGAFHAGWRGLAAGMVEAAVERHGAAINETIAASEKLSVLSKELKSAFDGKLAGEGCECTEPIIPLSNGTRSSL